MDVFLLAVETERNLVLQEEYTRRAFAIITNFLKVKKKYL